jgi:2-polyprenyl-3-methyl-5-hydroxy-6-metoxy-1,4-benzoquinol methylase
MEQTTISRQTIEEMIEGIDWYQKIPLGADLYTPGEATDTEAKLPMLELPEDMTGKSLLDIGCNEGFFAFEAERRGASPVLAVDAHKAVREKFEIVKSILNSNVEFMNLNVLDLDPGKIGEFDVVLFLAVFHHLRYPFLALDKIAAITRGVLILETPVAVPSGGDPATEDDPIMLRRYSSKHTTKLRHLPNVPFLLEILQRAGFAKVDVLGYHRRKKVVGYDGRYIERRVILKAYKDA